MDGGSRGPTGAVQFFSGAGISTGSSRFIFSGSESGSYTLFLTGTLKISGAISASSFVANTIHHIDATGSTFFGDSSDDLHIRTGSLHVSNGTYTTLLSASSTSHVVDHATFGATIESSGSATIKGGVFSHFEVSASGQLEAVGATLLGSTLSVTGAISGASTAEIVGATSLGNTLSVTGAISGGSTLEAVGATRLGSSLAVSGATSLQALSASAYSGSYTFHTQEAATFGSTLRSTGSATFKSIVIGSSVNNTIGHLDDVDLITLNNRTITLSADSILSGSQLSASRDVSVVGSITGSENLAISGNSIFAGNITVGGAIIGGSPVHVSGGLVISGSDGSVTYIGSGSTGGTSFSGSTTVTGSLLVSGSAVITGSLTVSGSSTIINYGSFENYKLDPTVPTGERTFFIRGTDGFLSGSNSLEVEGTLKSIGGVVTSGSIDGGGDLTMNTITMTGFGVTNDGTTSVKSLKVDDGSTVGSDSDPDLLTIAGDGNLQIKGNVSGSGVSIQAGAASFSSTIAASSSVTAAGVNSSALISGSDALVIMGHGNFGTTAAVSGTLAVGGGIIGPHADGTISSSAGITTAGTAVIGSTLTVSGNVTTAGDIILDDGGSIKEGGGTAAITIDASGHITKLGQSTHNTNDVLTWDGNKWVAAAGSSTSLSGTTAELTTGVETSGFLKVSGSSTLGAITATTYSGSSTLHTVGAATFGSTVASSGSVTSAGLVSSGLISGSDALMIMSVAQFGSNAEVTGALSVGGTLVGPHADGTISSSGGITTVGSITSSANIAASGSLVLGMGSFVGAHGGKENLVQLNDGHVLVNGALFVTDGISGSNIMHNVGAATFSSTLAVTGNITTVGDLILDDGGSIKEGGGTAAITIDSSGNVTKIGQDTPSTNEVLTYDGAKWVASVVGGGTATSVSGTTAELTTGVETSGYLKVSGSSTLTDVTATTYSGSSTMHVVGAATLGSTLAVTGAISGSDTLSIVGNMSSEGTLVLSGNITTAGDLILDDGGSIKEGGGVAAFTIDGSGNVTKIGLSTPSSGQFLKYDGAKWVASAVSAGAATSVSGTTAELTTGVETSGFLKVSGSSTFAGAISGSSTLEAVGATRLGSTLHVTGNITTAGDIILDDGGSLKEGGGTAAFTFDGDGNVTKIGQDSPSNNEVLTYDGAKWVSAPVGGGTATSVSGTTAELTTGVETSGYLKVSGSSTLSAITATTISASSTLQAVGATILGSTLSVSGSITASSGIRFPTAIPHASAAFGSSDQLQIYYNGTNPVIAAEGGHLNIRNNVSDKNIRLRMGDNGGATKVQFRSLNDTNLLTIDSNGDLSGSGASTQAGAASFSSTLAVTGAISGSSTLSVVGNVSSEGALTLSGNIDSGGDLTAATITMTGFTVDADGDTALKTLKVDDGSTIGCDSDADLLTLVENSLLLKGALSSSGASIQAGAANFSSTIAASSSVTAAGINSSALISGSSTLQAVGATILGNTLTVSGNITTAGDLILDDGGSIKEGGGTAAITIDGSGNVTKIGQDSPSNGEFLKYDGSKWVADSISATSLSGTTAELTTGVETSGFLKVSGSSTLAGITGISYSGSSTFHTVEAATFGTTLSVTGAISGSSTLSVVGDVSTEGDLIVSGTLFVPAKIEHAGDADTFINFSDDRIRLNAGNLELFGVQKKGSAPHQVTVNNGANNVDFVIKDSSNNEIVRADASTSRFGIGGVAAPTHTLSVSGDISGSSGFHAVGAVTMGSTLSLSGAISGSSTLEAVGATRLGSTLHVTGNITTAGDLILDDGGSIKEGGGTAAITIDGSGNVTKIGQDSPSTGEFLKYDGDKWVADAASAGAATSVSGTTAQLTTGVETSGFLKVSGSSTFAGAVSGSSTLSIVGNMSSEGALVLSGNIDSGGDLTAATITMAGFAVDADGDTALKSLAVDDGSTIGCDSDTDLLTLVDGALLINGNVSGSGTSIQAGAASFSSTIAATGSVTAAGLNSTGLISGSNAITVVGNASFTGNLNASGNLSIQGTEPRLMFTGSDGTALGQIGYNASNNILIQNNFNNKHIVFKATDNSVVKEGIRLDGSVPEVVVNQNGASGDNNTLVDFRVESDNNTHMLFVDGGNDKVGINTDIPLQAFSVVGGISGSSTLEVVGAASFGSTIAASSSVTSVGVTNTGIYSGSSTMNVIGEATFGAAVLATGSVVGNVLTASGGGISLGNIIDAEIAGADQSGTNQAGKNLIIRPSNGTGNGAPAFVEIQAPVPGSSGTTVQTASPVIKASSEGPTLHFNAVDTLLDDEGLGEILRMGTGTTTAGKLYYLHSSSAWLEADANIEQSGSANLLAIALGSNPANNGMLVKGFFDVNTYFTGAFPVGQQVYMSDTAGRVSGYRLSGSGEVVRVIGHATAQTNVIYFNPSPDFIVL